MIRTESYVEGEENSTQKVYLHGEVVELKSGNNSVKYAYDSKRRLNAVELNGVENYVQYAYTETLDSNGTVTKETVITTYESEDEFVSETDGKGNLLKLTANNVVQIENVYNNKNQLDTLKDKVASKNYKFERDVLDNVTAIYEVNASGTKVSGGYDERITYDEFGSLKTRTLSGVVSQVYDYSYSDDSKRQVKSLVTPITSEEYEYDALNRKKKTSQVFAGHNFGKRYNYKKVSDHATNLIESIAYLKNGITDGKLSYTYDNMGNITSINENGKQIAKYTYDALNRIIKENLLDKSKEIVYTYDNNGNILTKSVNGEIVEYKYKEDSDQLVSFGDEAFEYDSIGNPTTFRSMTAVFENGRRLKSLSDGTNTVEYTYNGQGLRKSKKVGSVTTTYTYDGNGRLLKEVGEKTIEYVYGADGIIGIKINETPYLFRKNMLGDVTHIYNQQGVLVGKYSYTEFGECTVELDTNSVASDNPIRYRSYYYDDETSLYYLKTRYYDPELGRFMTIDGIEYLDPETINGLNLYAYCGNNPVMYIDPDGHEPKWWQWALFGIGLALVAVATGMAIIGTGGVAAFGMGALIGSLSIGAVGAVAGGAIGYATGGVDGILGGALTGFGIGAIAGFIIGGSVGTSIYGSQLGTTYRGVGQLVKNPKIDWVSSKFPHVGQRMAERNVSSKLIGKTLKNGYAFMQTSDKYLIVGRKAAVVVTSAGEVITTWASNNYDQKLMEVLRSIFGFLGG